MCTMCYFVVGTSTIAVLRDEQHGCVMLFANKQHGLVLHSTHIVTFSWWRHVLTVLGVRRHKLDRQICDHAADAWQQSWWVATQQRKQCPSWATVPEGWQHQKQVPVNQYPSVRTRLLSQTAATALHAIVSLGCMLVDSEPLSVISTPWSVT